MSLADVKFAYMACVLLLSLVISAPALSLLIVFPSAGRFSELYLLGPDRMAEARAPLNVFANVSYTSHVVVANHMDSLEYYEIYVKLRNQTEPLPNDTIGIASSLNGIVSYQVFLSDDDSWEKTLTFSFGNVSFEGNNCRVNEFTIDGREMGLDKIVSWDPVNSGFYYQLFFELWVFNNTNSRFEYSNRFVALWLNITRGVL